MRAVTFAVLIGLATCTSPAGAAEPSGPNLGKAPDVQNGAPPQADLPRVVLVGDSIRLGYAPTVEKELAGKAVVLSPQANGGDSSNVLKNLDAWVIREQPDVVHFNCGIHDIKKSRTTGQFQIPPEQYETNLRKIVDRIRKETQATVVFATSTPIIDGRAAQVRTAADYELLEASIEQYNRIARKVMDDFKVPVNDLHGLLPDGEARVRLIGSDGVHLVPEGSQMLGKAVAAVVAEHLPGAKERSPAVVSARDSFRPGDLWPDNNGVHINAHGGGILVHEGTFYWFGQHMVEGEAGNAAQVGVHVYSSKDLYNWHDEGTALCVSDDPQSEITRGCILERPKVIHNRKTGKFVMWFHLELKGQGYRAARSGVAVADQPTGPYRFLESFRPNAGHWPVNVPTELKRPLTTEEEAYLRSLHLTGGPVPDYPEDLIFRRDHAGGQMARDMTLFVDDDGTAYHIYASEENGTLHISQLIEDYLRPAGKYVRVLPGGFNEAPAVMKHAGRYYLITSGCTGWTPNAARLAVADSIWGPWMPLGNPCIGKDAEMTFQGQSTFVLPLPGKAGAFIFMADRWNPKNAIDGRHLWLPVQFREAKPLVEWVDEWDLSFFDRTARTR